MSIAVKRQEEIEEVVNHYKDKFSGLKESSNAEIGHYIVSELLHPESEFDPLELERIFRTKDYGMGITFYHPRPRGLDVSAMISEDKEIELKTRTIACEYIIDSIKKGQEALKNKSTPEPKEEKNLSRIEKLLGSLFKNRKDVVSKADPEAAEQTFDMNDLYSSDRDVFLLVVAAGGKDKKDLSFSENFITAIADLENQGCEIDYSTIQDAIITPKNNTSNRLKLG